MKKSGIAIKIFIIIVVVLSINSIIQSLFSAFFLEQLYRQKKVEQSTTALISVAQTLSQTSAPDVQLKAIRNFIGQTNDAIIIIDDNGVYHPVSEMTLFDMVMVLSNKDDHTKKTVIPLYGRLFNITSKDLGKIVSVEYIVTDDTKSVGRIRFNGKWYTLFEMFADDQSASTTHTVDYTLREFYLADTSDAMHSKTLALEKYTSDYYDNTQTDQSDLYQIISYRMGNYTYFTALSLKMINDVVAVQNTFQWYLLAAMLGVALVAAWLVSRTIAKPIENLARQADAYVKLDVPDKIDETRTDEIGHLSRRVHSMAKSLKEKIARLEDDIAFEKRQERIRKQFVSDVSHELKTPLGVIKSYAEGIADNTDRVTQQRYISIINGEVDKMNRLILDMLDLSALEATRGLVERQRVNLRRMIEHIYNSFKPLAAERQVVVNLQLDDCFVDVDSKKYETVIANLISNAFRYVEKGGRVDITLSAASIPTLVIENSCPPIEPAEFNKLWDRFYRIDQSRSKQLGGSGLGLAIVKHILDLHGHNYQLSAGDLGFKVTILLDD